MAEVKVGEVMKFFSKPSVAAVKITGGDLAHGDRVRYTGHTTDFEDTVSSMEVDNEKIEKVGPGDYVGIRVSDRVRAGDEVFKIIPD